MTGEGGPPCHCGDERVVRAGGADDGGGGRGWPTENTRYSENTVLVLKSVTHFLLTSHCLHILPSKAKIS